MQSSEPLSEDHQHSSNPCPTEQPSVEEFQFLRCQDCQAEAKCPKLLPCLHSLCSGCLLKPDMQCPICKVPDPPGTDPQFLDNVFFESLQRHLALHRQVMDENAVCTRCKEFASFWCTQCEQLLCPKCYEAHWYYLKHETQPLAELRGQSVLEFLGNMRKTNNIFCSHTKSHHTPQTTSIYCRGCAKALCVSCVILDSDDHKDLRCDIRTEIEQRQEELDSMTQALQEQEAAFSAVQAQIHHTVSELGHQRADTEELIRARIRQVLEHVQLQEQELLEAVSLRYQRDYDQMAGKLQRLEAVLQRIQTGRELVQRMKRYASDQEMLDMHDFLHQALRRLSQEVVQSPEATVRINGFDEVKARLQDLISGITQGADLPVPKGASPEAASTPQTRFDIDLGVEVQATGPAQTQPVAVVQLTPGAYPWPVRVYSIRDLLCREENTPVVTPQKRKSCQTESPRKMVKLASEGEREVRLEQNTAEQPGPSTSSAVSQLPLEVPLSPSRAPVEDKDLVPHSNHLADDPKETGPAVHALSPTEHPSLSPTEHPISTAQQAAPEPECSPSQPTAEEGVVVISSSEDSDTENSDLDVSSSESSGVHLEGPSSLQALEEVLTDPQAEDRPLVFFDLRIDNETQKISQLAAVNGESKFRVLIHSKACFSVYSKTVSLEVGLELFLRFLSTMPRPILACYKLWGPGLPHFFHALQDMNQLSQFKEVTSGFLALLPLIRECLPGASNFQLKSLAKTYLARNISESSALASVLTMRDLCQLLEVFPGPRLAPHIYSFSCMRCFASLQPLVRADVLPRPEARLLALRNVDFVELQNAHRQDPQGGLKRYRYYLSLPEPLEPSLQTTSILQALSSYLDSLPQGPSSAKVEALGTPSPSPSSDVVERTPQQS